MFVPLYPYPVVGGLEKQAHELAKALKSVGMEIQVLSGKISTAQNTSEEVEGIQVFRMPWWNSKLLRFLFIPFVLFFHLFRLRKQFDVLHVHQHSSVSLFAILCCRILHKPVLAKLANVGIHGLVGLNRGIFGKIRTKIFLSADAVVAMAPASYNELLTSGYTVNRILTVPNGIPINSDRNRSSRNSTSQMNAVFVGRLMPQKNVEMLLKAWAIVCNDSQFKAHLHIWGDGPLKEELKAMTMELRINHRITFAGYVSDVNDKLTAMDLFILPSNQEGNSNAILEAMKAGLPVITTDVGGARLQVGPAGQDLIVKPGDCDALAERILLLVRNPKMIESIGAEMRLRVEHYFSIHHVARCYQSCYIALAEGRHYNVYKASNTIKEISDSIRDSGSH